MATTIKLKNSVTTTNAPSSLVQGEVAINITDKKVWVGNAATTPIQLLGAGASGTFGALTCTSLTNSGLTSGRVTYASTGGLLADSANLTFNGTTFTAVNDASISGLTVGKGGSAISTNTAVGLSALGNNTTGSEIVAVGENALSANTTGAANVAIGRYALGTNTTGAGNLAVGSRQNGVTDSPLRQNTTGNYNIALGNGALRLNTTGSNNIGIGLDSLAANTTASNNTAVGYQAGYSNTTGNDNVYVGTLAGYATTTGAYITAVGRSALAANTTGNYNTAVGRTALSSNTTGSSNTALGQDALSSNTTASNNTAVGYQAGYSNTTGYNNIAVGYQSLYSNTTGYENNATGVVTLYANTTGAFNSSYGNASLRFNTTGNYNTAMGVNALYSNTTANNNTAVGFQAGYSNTVGGNSVYSGYQAGYTNNAGWYNTFIGYQAGYSSYVSGGAYDSKNTFIGWSSGYAVSTGVKNTILGSFNGNQGGLDIRTASNYIVLSDGDGNPRVVVNSAGYLKAMPNQADVLNIGGSYHELISNDDANNTLYVANKSTNTTTNGMVRLDAYRNTTNNTFYVLSYYNQGAGAYKLRIADSGNVTNTNGSYGTISDVKNKENIVDATPKLDKINQLQVRNFNFKGDDLKQIGFIAQEFEQVFPSMVEEHKDTDADGNDLGTTTKSIKTSVLVPILVKAVQELTAKVEALEAQLNK